MLYYCKLPQGNFGDDLNPWLFSRLAPEVCDPKSPTLFVGIGTILGPKIPKEPLKAVFGSGWGGGPLPEIDGKWTIHCVRGPVTAAALGLDPALAVTDPAILVRRFTTGPVEKRYPVSYMPHHQSMARADWAALCKRAGFHCIDPRNSVEQVLGEVRGTALLLTEAMHGSIVADALRVPWIPVRMYGDFTGIKWRDWTQSIGVPLRINDIPGVFEQAPAGRKRLEHAVKKGLAKAGLGREHWRRLETRASTEREISRTLLALERLAREQSPLLSDEGVMQRHEDRLMEKLAALRAAW